VHQALLLMAELFDVCLHHEDCGFDRKESRVDALFLLDVGRLRILLPKRSGVREQQPCLKLTGGWRCERLFYMCGRYRLSHAERFAQFNELGITAEPRLRRV
jgi:hypothetical protein